MTRTSYRRTKSITGPERDEIVNGLKALMKAWNIGPTTISKLAQIATREGRG